MSFLRYARGQTDRHARSSQYFAPLSGGKRKERKSIYIAPFCTKVHTKLSGMDHRVLPANNTVPAFPSWAFTRWHHHNKWGSRHPIAADGVRDSRVYNYISWWVSATDNSSVICNKYIFFKNQNQRIQKKESWSSVNSPFSKITPHACLDRADNSCSNKRTIAITGDSSRLI